MPYYNQRDDKVTLTKRNHRYYGPTESSKIDGSVTEVAVDLSTIYRKINELNDSIDALASGYLVSDENLSSLHNIRCNVNRLEGKIYNMMYIQS